MFVCLHLSGTAYCKTGVCNTICKTIHPKINGMGRGLINGEWETMALVIILPQGHSSFSCCWVFWYPLWHSLPSTILLVPSITTFQSRVLINFTLFTLSTEPFYTLTLLLLLPFSSGKTPCISVNCWLINYCDMHSMFSNKW